MDVKTLVGGHEPGAFDVAAHLKGSPLYLQQYFVKLFSYKH